MSIVWLQQVMSLSLQAAMCSDLFILLDIFLLCFFVSSPSNPLGTSDTQHVQQKLD